MSGTTLIFRLCDEDEEESLNLAAEPPAQPGQRPPQGPRPSRTPWCGLRRSEGPEWGQSHRADQITWPDPEPGRAEPNEGSSSGLVGEDWPADPDPDASTGLFAWDDAEADDRDHRTGAEAGASWAALKYAKPVRYGSRSWYRVVAAGAIAVVALLVVVIGHSARPAGRGPVEQRSVEAAAVGASAGAPLPSTAASPRSGRRPFPQPPAATPSKPRRAPRDPRPRPQPAGRAVRATVPRRPDAVEATAAAEPAQSPAPVPVSAAPSGRLAAPAAAPAPAPVQREPAPPAQVAPSLPPAEFSFER